jgi:hypothetical protein
MLLALSPASYLAAHAGYVSDDSPHGHVKEQTVAMQGSIAGGLPKPLQGRKSGARDTEFEA